MAETDDWAEWDDEYIEERLDDADDTDESNPLLDPNYPEGESCGVDPGMAEITVVAEDLNWDEEGRVIPAGWGPVHRFDQPEEWTPEGWQ